MLKKVLNFINNLFPYKTQGKNNQIFVTYNGKKKRLRRKLNGLNISMKGTNNYLEIELPISFEDTNIALAGENAVCIIKKTPIKVNKASIYVSSWGRCFIDEGICAPLIIVDLCAIQTSSPIMISSGSLYGNFSPTL